MTERSTSAEEDPAKRSNDEQPDERSAGFVLYSVDGGVRRYLLLRHRYGGHWGFPKGHIEVGESEMEAALRETREETGIDAVTVIPGFQEVSRYRFRRGNRPVFKENTYFLARAEHTRPVLSREHTQAEWLPYSEARERLSFADMRGILDLAEAMLTPSR
jgi:8-oxo-dGTP pyrophosphatase MutT (NUDIX family)